jgi:hypothetical protein
VFDLGVMQKEKVGAVVRDHTRDQPG